MLPTNAAASLSGGSDVGETEAQGGRWFPGALMDFAGMHFAVIGLDTGRRRRGWRRDG